MKLVQFFLPVYDNNGNAFDPRAFETLKRALTDKFGGVTVYKRTEGYWKETDNEAKKDDILIYEVMTETVERDYWQDLKENLMAKFRQEAIMMRYFRVDLL